MPQMNSSVAVDAMLPADTGWPHLVPPARRMCVVDGRCGASRAQHARLHIAASCSKTHALKGKRRASCSYACECAVPSQGMEGAQDMLGLSCDQGIRPFCGAPGFGVQCGVLTSEKAGHKGQQVVRVRACRQPRAVAVERRRPECIRLLHQQTPLLSPAPKRSATCHMLQQACATQPHKLWLLGRPVVKNQTLHRALQGCGWGAPGRRCSWRACASCSPPRGRAPASCAPAG
jgi:hypothetical protein